MEGALAFELTGEAEAQLTSWLSWPAADVLVFIPAQADSKNRQLPTMKTRSTLKEK